jgi:hypothetical protein
LVTDKSTFIGISDAQILDPGGLRRNFLLNRWVEAPADLSVKMGMAEASSSPVEFSG